MSSEDEIRRRELANANKDDFDEESAVAIEPWNKLKMVRIPEQELERLKEKNRQQARQLRIMQEAAEAKNLELDAMHFVWCDGGCVTGAHRYHSETILTEDLILRAERNTKRLRSYYNSVKYALEHWPITTSEWHRRYAMAAASRTDLLTKDDDNAE